jgi:hypothetical protein
MQGSQVKVLHEQVTVKAKQTLNYAFSVVTTVG